MPNLKTITPHLLSTTAMLLISLTGCQDETKQIDTKPGDKADQRKSDKAERLEDKAERLEDKAERMELEADQQEARDSDKPLERMENKIDNTMDKIDDKDEFDTNQDR